MYEHQLVHLFGLDVHLVVTCFQYILWGYAHASPCLETLLLEPHFAQSCGRFLLLYCVLGWADFAATPQDCCACVGQVVVCRAASLHLSMLRQTGEKRP